MSKSCSASDKKNKRGVTLFNFPQKRSLREELFLPKWLPYFVLLIKKKICCVKRSNNYIIFKKAKIILKSRASKQLCQAYRQKMYRADKFRRFNHTLNTIRVQKRCFNYFVSKEFRPIK